MSDDTVKVPRVSRSYYEDGQKPDTEKMKRDAIVDGDEGTTKTYHPGGDKNKNGVITEYSNGNKVTIWDCEHGDGKVTKATAIKIGDKSYIDWESDGKIDCVDTTTFIEMKKEEHEKQIAAYYERLGIPKPLEMPKFGLHE